MTRRWSVVGAAVFAALGCREAPTRIAVRVDSPGLREGLPEKLEASLRMLANLSLLTA